MSANVIVAGARTPIGRLLGGLKSLTAAEPLVFHDRGYHRVGTST